MAKIGIVMATLQGCLFFKINDLTHVKYLEQGRCPVNVNPFLVIFDLAEKCRPRDRSDRQSDRYDPWATNCPVMQAFQGSAEVSRIRLPGLRSTQYRFDLGEITYPL